MRYGKRPARSDSVSLKFSDIFDSTALPTPPAVFGHQAMVLSWGMLANDKVGDCVFAGAAHEHMLWTVEGGQCPASFSDESVLFDYSAVTGYDPTDWMTDQGTDMQVAASYRRKTGVLDSSGARHKISAYVSLRRGDEDQLALASWLTGAVGTGINMPASAEDQFDRGLPWDVVPGVYRIVGGHYVPVVGRLDNGNFVVVTWGRLQQMTPAFFSKYNDEGIAYLSPEIINVNKLSPEGFDLATLTNFLRSLS